MATYKGMKGAQLSPGAMPKLQYKSWCFSARKLLDKEDKPLPDGAVIPEPENFRRYRQTTISSRAEIQEMQMPKECNFRSTFAFVRILPCQVGNLSKARCRQVWAVFLPLLTLWSEGRAQALCSQLRAGDGTRTSKQLLVKSQVFARAYFSGPFHRIVRQADNIPGTLQVGCQYPRVQTSAEAFKASVFS